MSGPISPENQGLVGAALIAYGGLVIGGAYYLANRDASTPPQKTHEASDRNSTPSSPPTHSPIALLQILTIDPSRATTIGQRQKARVRGSFREEGGDIMNVMLLPQGAPNDVAAARIRDLYQGYSGSLSFSPFYG